MALDQRAGTWYQGLRRDCSEETKLRGKSNDVWRALFTRALRQRYRRELFTRAKTLYRCAPMQEVIAMRPLFRSLGLACLAALAATAAQAETGILCVKV